MVVPLASLNQVDQRRCEWLVPGLCIEKVQLYLKSLPQKLRRHCVPLPDFAKGFVERVNEAGRFGEGDFLESIIADIRSQTQIQTQRTDFRPENLPLHCFMNFRLVDEYGRQIDLDRNLGQLRAEYAQTAREAFKEVAALAVTTVDHVTPVKPSEITHPSEQHQAQPAVSLSAKETGTRVTEQITSWTFGVLPEMLEIKQGKQTLYGYPALVDKTLHCNIEVFDDPELARRTHLQGLRRLFALQMKDTLKALHKQLPGARDMGLLFMNLGQSEDLITQVLDLALERACLMEPLPIDDTSFKERLDAGKPKLALIAQEIARHALTSLQAYADVLKRLAQLKALSTAAHADVMTQLDKLIHAKFVAKTPYEYLVHLPRYLKAIVMRIDKLRSNPARDQQCQNEWQSLLNPWQKLIQSQKAYGGSLDPRLEDFRWQLEELRVALYAQELRTPTPMSSKRLQKILDSIKK
jgi:ATP-dependent helicase HrpA